MTVRGTLPAEGAKAILVRINSNVKHEEFIQPVLGSDVWEATFNLTLDVGEHTVNALAVDKAGIEVNHQTL